MDSSKYHVGQRVIAVRSQSQGIFKKGLVREILGIRKPSCGCLGLFLDLGIPIPDRFCQENSKCSKCKKTYPTHGIFWSTATSWAPIDDTLSETDYDAILDKMNKTVHRDHS